MTYSEVVGATRERMGPVGVWMGVLSSMGADEERLAAQRIEELGYGSIWCGERLGGREAFAHVGVLLAATERIVAGTGIATVWARRAATMQAGGATLGAFYPGRFVLGIGVSHAPSVERSGQTYERPLNHMARYIDGMDVAAGSAQVPDEPFPRVLAALRPHMLDLARDRADGAHPYFVSPSHTALAREALGPDKLLIPEQAVVLITDRGDAHRVARDHMAGYLQLPNYVNNLKHLGFDDEDISSGGSDHLVDAIVAWGDVDHVAARIREHLDAGADHVLLQPLGEAREALHQLETLAPAVLADESSRSEPSPRQ